ncbi:Sucrose nonfermenting 4-like protein [Morella rubra]|uniref:Sucrose nonfermenting 4-like protein n=1 Tax=Morella rubra TaxID=262757 RepID=A0A6A1W748_9ROSI|nr:Sucrose nonfermenting 4-like protein [Morella rubra]
MLSLTTSSTHLLVSSTSPPHLSPLCLSALRSLRYLFETERKKKEITEKQFVSFEFCCGEGERCSVRGFPRRLCGGGCSGFVRRSANWDSEGFCFGVQMIGVQERIKEAGGVSEKERAAYHWKMKEFWKLRAVMTHVIRNMETAEEYESGIEGILNRLEKQRNRTFGIKLKQKGNDIRLESDHGKDDWHSGTSMDTTVAGLESSKLTSVSSNKHIHNDLGGNPGNDKTFFDVDGLRNSLNPNTWRTWSIQRAGFSDASFEAAEIATIETRTEGPMDGTRDEILEVREIVGEPLVGSKDLSSCSEEIAHNGIRGRLQHLELELSSVLRSLRLNADEVISQKAHESSSDELQNLSDAWEFQENEIMNAQGRLRSIRAKLAVLEGKMAIAIIDAQKMVEEKQKRIDDARIAFRLLRATCVVWPSSASEVLLAGSFDGWATQRKMKASSTGVFSLCLKLYPGRYEIKFIVDGEWRVDPLRPIVNNNGYENNVLIIT